MEPILKFFKERPAVAVIIALVVGLLLGLGWAWGIQPVEWIDSPVEKLRADLRMEYMSMTDRKSVV